jgi:hypothetical protein
VEAWSFFPFLFLLLQPIILYLLAGLCFPDFSDRGRIDFRDFYYRNHRWFFGLFALFSAARPPLHEVRSFAPSPRDGFVFLAALLGEEAPVLPLLMTANNTAVNGCGEIQNGCGEIQFKACAQS